MITKPAWARVYLDGEYKGETPKFLKLEVGKSYELKIGKERYETINKKLYIPRKGEVIEKVYRLNALPEVPHDPEPYDGAKGVETEVTLRWKSKDPDGGAGCI